MTTDSILNTANVLVALETGEPLKFLYKDKDGVTSFRTATVKCIERSSDGHIVVRTHDESRVAARTFRLDRIVNTLLPGEQFTVATEAVT